MKLKGKAPTLSSRRTIDCCRVHRLPSQVAKWHVKMLDDYAGFCKGIKNDPSPDGATGTIEFVQAEMTKQGEWCKSFQGVDSVMHLQAWNPYPEATWEDCRLSMDITNNAIAAAQ